MSLDFFERDHKENQVVSRQSTYLPPHTPCKIKGSIGRYLAESSPFLTKTWGSGKVRFFFQCTTVFAVVYFMWTICLLLETLHDHDRMLNGPLKNIIHHNTELCVGTIQRNMLWNFFYIFTSFLVYYSSSSFLQAKKLVILLPDCIARM